MKKTTTIYLLVGLLLTVITATGLHAQTAEADTLPNNSTGIGSLTEFSVDNSMDNVTKQAGDSAYLREDYSSAIQIYEALLRKGEAMEVYYNLGNSYYKTRDYAHAILNYERALLLSPGNSDVRFNLDLARSKTVDRENTVSELFFLTWIKAVTNRLSSDAWARWGIAFFILLLAGTGVYLFSKDIRLRKAGFAVAVLGLVFCILSNVCANSQKNRLVDRHEAIIMQPSVTVRSTPSDSGTELFVLHEGHKVSVTDASMQGWKEIRIADGKKGWVSTEAIEVI